MASSSTNESFVLAKLKKIIENRAALEINFFILGAFLLRNEAIFYEFQDIFIRISIAS